MIYHVLNRANARLSIFEKDGDYEAFERILADAIERTGTRLLAYCLMPNHWHLAILPVQDGELSRFTGWLTLTDTQSWHAHRHSTGQGHVYQGRFKSFPIQDDQHFLTACRYVERDALRAKLVAKAQDWKWSSLWRWNRGNAKEKSILSAWPVRRTPNWLDYERTADRTGAGSDPAECKTRMPLGRARLHIENHREVGAKDHYSTARNTQKRFLTPFCFLLQHSLKVGIDEHFQFHNQKFQIS